MVLLKYYDRNVQSFLEYFKKTQQKLQEEPIHQLRVHIKRMRAILELVEITSQGKFRKKHHFTLFSRFFNYAGNLREIQVNHMLIKKFQHNGIGDFEEYLRRHEKQAGKKLHKVVIDFDTEQFEKMNRQIRSAVEAMDEKKIISESEKFVSREIRKIKKLRFKLSDPRDLHKIRILLKSTNAILKLLEEYKPDNKWAKLKKDVKPLELLIGEWHDKQVLASTMKQFINNNEDGGQEMESIKKLMKQIEQENEKTAKLLGGKLDMVFCED